MTDILGETKLNWSRWDFFGDLNLSFALRKENSVSLMMLYPDTTLCWTLFILRRQSWYLVTRVMDKFSRGRPRQSSSKCELQKNLNLTSSQAKQTILPGFLFVHGFKMCERRRNYNGKLNLNSVEQFSVWIEKYFISFGSCSGVLLLFSLALDTRQ